jgi:RyR domain-containing protein
MKTIVVAGDLIWDYNLVKYPITPAYHHEFLSPTVLWPRAGGAWYLKDIIEQACSDLPAKIYAPPQQDDRISREGNRFNQAYQIWSLYDKISGDSEKKKVWRISQFLGCRQASDSKIAPLHPTGNVKNPDILVLDNLCLSFRDCEELWPAALKKGGNPKQVVLKTSSADFTSPLWKLLMDKFADRLTVVLSATVLRERGAALSQGLSWDSTIEEIVNEFKEGVSAQDLGRCWRVVVLFGYSEAASFTRDGLKFGDVTSKKGKGLQFERFLYDPARHEGTWKTTRPGQVFGASTILTAAVVRHVLQPEDYPLYIALERALAAIRANHELGGGESQEKCDPEAVDQTIRQILNPAREKEKDPVFEFCTAYPRIAIDSSCGVLVDSRQTGRSVVRSDLLRDVTGDGFEYVAAKAAEVVICGPEKALREAPEARYGRYRTVDREEIERINAIQSLIISYKNNPLDRKPLSIAVFGPPGSGKSFAIKQLLSTVFGKENKPLEFNLSQFGNVEDLCEAFHQVRDRSIQGQIALVFWDEFDVNELRWLKEFLVPMQDTEFRSGSINHPFGKSIFIFAGGTSSSCEEFDRSGKSDKEGKIFRAKKGPDFVSRLRGYVNIKGPNPLPPGLYKKDSATKKKSHPSTRDLAEQDVAHLIRRAVILRASLERLCPRIIDPRTGMASISAGVINAFLRTEEFLHGARSIEAIVSMSRLGKAKCFDVSALPSRDLLRLHATEDFLEYLHHGQVEMPIVEILARVCHESWKVRKEKDGWKLGKKRDDKKKMHPLLVSYEELREKDKESNRKPARLTQAILYTVGYEIKKKTVGDKPGTGIRVFPEKIREKLMKIEHDIWLRDNLINGYEWAKETDDDLRLHRDVQPFKKVPPEDQELDWAIVKSIPKSLAENGYILIKRTSDEKKSEGAKTKRKTSSGIR